MRDPYEVLGVGKDASAKDIKKAYRKLARDLHPDLHPGDSKAEARFKDVSAAYDFLSDTDRKARYDRGEIDASGAPRAERRFYRTYAEADPGARYNDPTEFFKDLEGTDLFSDLFGGRRRTKTAGWRGSDAEMSLEIDFVDAVLGTTTDIVLPTGKHLKVTIAPGSADGQILRLKEQGMPGVGKGEPGDLLITLKVRPHRIFTRKGNDIDAEVAVTLPEAILGGRIDVPTVDGTVTMTVPKGANTGTRLRLRGKGVPRSDGGRGDQYVTLKVVLPDPPDAELERLVERWAADHQYQIRRTS